MYLIPASTHASIPTQSVHQRSARIPPLSQAGPSRLKGSEAFGTLQGSPAKVGTGFRISWLPFCFIFPRLAATKMVRFLKPASTCQCLSRPASVRTTDDMGLHSLVSMATGYQNSAASTRGENILIVTMSLACQLAITCIPAATPVATTHPLCMSLQLDSTAWSRTNTSLNTSWRPLPAHSLTVLTPRQQPARHCRWLSRLSFH